MNNPITIQTTIAAPIEKVWSCFTNADHITKWNFAHESWHCPASVNDVVTGGRFVTTMAAVDGSIQFDFSGTYQLVVPNQILEVLLDDGRKWNTSFRQTEQSVIVTEVFEPETQNTIELQEAGWLAILENFKKYVEQS